jgi:hypothetical protein
LWIAIGAVIAIAVIAVVAMQIPKFRKTAAENAPASASEVASQAPESSPVVPSPQTQAPVLPATSQENSTQPAQVAAAPASSVQPAQLKAVARTTAAPYRPATVAASPVSSQAVSGNQRTAGAPASAPSEDPKTAEELKEVREQLNLLSIRMDTVKVSLDTLRKQQAASGLGLRPDMASSAQRMEYQYSQTDTALKNRDAAAARKSLDLAEREVSKLENFLGK